MTDPTAAPAPGSWMRYRRRRTLFRTLGLFSGGIALAAFLFLWWKNLHGAPLTRHDLPWLLAALAGSTLSVVLFWHLAESGLVELEIFMRETQSLLGGTLTFRQWPDRRRFLGLADVRADASPTPWWAFVDERFVARLRTPHATILAVLHVPRFGRRFLEIRIGAPRARFPVLWLWFHPPFRMGFEIEGAYVDSREGLAAVRPYLGILKDLKTRYGFTNLRHQDKTLELRFHPFRGTPGDFPDILDAVRRLP